MTNVTLQTVKLLPADYTLKTVKTTPVVGLVIFHVEGGRGVVVVQARDCWTIAFEDDKFSGDYSPSFCYKKKLVRCLNPGFDRYMQEYICFYA